MTSKAEAKWYADVIRYSIAILIFLIAYHLADRHSEDPAEDEPEISDVAPQELEEIQ